MHPTPPETAEPEWDPAAIPAATVVVLRSRPALEVLLLQRSEDVSFARGAWVFPGGRIDPSDAAGGTGVEASARNAAVRETHEETGLTIATDDLTRWSHWTPPERAGRRYTTAFFCADITNTSVADESAEVTVDGTEIVAHEWFTPAAAMAARDAGRITLTPPTFITLSQLSRFTRTAQAIEHARSRPVEHFATRIGVDGDTWIALYHGDVAYEHAELGPPAAEFLHAEGDRHRLLMGPTWAYQRSAATE